jgi:hydroxypyruvate reductase
LTPAAENAEIIWRAALDAVDPHRAVHRAVSLDGEALHVGDAAVDVGGCRIRIVGAGKAAVPMAEAVIDLLGDRIDGGIVITKRGHGEDRGAVGPIAIRAGGHPLPDADGARAAAEIAALLTGGAERDLVVALLSGGGSSLLALPDDGVSLDDLRAASDAFILGGADVIRLNTLRKHLTRLSGGRLARLAAPARVVALILSDVVGDPLDAIASGPTTPDPTTFGDALAAVRALGLEAAIPGPVLERLRLGASGAIDETPKPGDPLFDRVTNHVVAGNRTAVDAAAAKARALGYFAEIAAADLCGEARARGRDLAARGAEISRGEGTPRLPACLVFGGETTVTVRGKGRGGRNQELALGAALELEARGCESACVVAISTDGQDGPTDAAGAAVDATTCARIRAAGIDPVAALADNDSFTALDAAGALIRTGPTRTNAADLALVLVDVIR